MLKMGLISDRKSNKSRSKDKVLDPHAHSVYGHAHSGKGFLNHHPLRPHAHAGGQHYYPQPAPNLPKYPPGYYTTPVKGGSKGSKHHHNHGGHHHANGNHSGLASQQYGGSQMLHPGYGNSHPNQPKYNPNVSPRYQTWVAGSSNNNNSNVNGNAVGSRKQPALGQLVNNPHIKKTPLFIVKGFIKWSESESIREVSLHLHIWINNGR